MKLIAKEFSPANLEGVIISLAFQAAMYHVWMERNARRFQNKNRIIFQIVEAVLWEVISKVDSSPSHSDQKMEGEDSIRRGRR